MYNILNDNIAMTLSVLVVALSGILLFLYGFWLREYRLKKLIKRDTKAVEVLITEYDQLNKG